MAQLSIDWTNLGPRPAKDCKEQHEPRAESSKAKAESEPLRRQSGGGAAEGRPWSELQWASVPFSGHTVLAAAIG